MSMGRIDLNANTLNVKTINMKKRTKDHIKEIVHGLGTPESKMKEIVEYLKKQKNLTYKVNGTEITVTTTEKGYGGLQSTYIFNTNVEAK